MQACRQVKRLQEALRDGLACFAAFWLTLALKASFRIAPPCEPRLTKPRENGYPFATYGRRYTVSAILRHRPYSMTSSSQIDCFSNYGGIRQISRPPRTSHGR